MPFSTCGRDQILYQKTTATKTRTTLPGTEKPQLITTNNQTQQLTAQRINIKFNQHTLPARPVTAGESDHYPLTTNNKIYIATINTRTLRTSESLLELEEVLKDIIHWDVIGISEMR
ncbi:hypothetical protein EVAR_21957_1 [Eumeta japonica]|uniref:Uncharacterized protein n=1 Tax=Eumeta variegata TaxID=151549 RepID=A0A4C1VWE9_EUMVA|nr:hypothetical protein EVAR_21957_1 [Eumeta japonica]